MVRDDLVPFLLSPSIVLACIQFQEDAWVRPNGGGGISRVLTGGKVFEKAGVNLSVVYGTMPQEVGASLPIPNVWGMYQLDTSRV